MDLNENAIEPSALQLLQGVEPEAGHRLAKRVEFTRVEDHAFAANEVRVSIVAEEVFHVLRNLAFGDRGGEVGTDARTTAAAHARSRKRNMILKFDGGCSGVVVGVIMGFALRDTVCKPSKVVSPTDPSQAIRY